MNARDDYGYDARPETWELALDEIDQLRDFVASLKAQLGLGGGPRQPGDRVM